MDNYFLLPARFLFYLGVSFLETHLLDAEVRHLESSALVGRGSMFALSDEKGLITHCDGDGRITVYGF